jgi:hypothetical protein
MITIFLNLYFILGMANAITRPGAKKPSYAADYKKSLATPLIINMRIFYSNGRNYPNIAKRDV